MGESSFSVLLALSCAVVTACGSRTDPAFEGSLGSIANDSNSSNSDGFVEGTGSNDTSGDPNEDPATTDSNSGSTSNDSTNGDSTNTTGEDPGTQPPGDEPMTDPPNMGSPQSRFFRCNEYCETIQSVDCNGDRLAEDMDACVVTCFRPRGPCAAAVMDAFECVADNVDDAVVCTNSGAQLRCGPCDDALSRVDQLCENAEIGCAFR